MKSGDLPSANH